jgi:hypothetical protein
MMTPVGLGDGTTIKAPPPAVGATLIGAAAIVLILGMVWLGRDDEPSDRLVFPTVEGVTMPTDAEGEPIALPPSQPAVPVSFGVDGLIIRPEATQARVIDESGNEVLVPLPPGSVVDVVTGKIVPELPTTGTTRPGSTTGTTRPGSTTTDTTGGPTTTEDPTTTTETPTTTEDTTPTTEPPPDPGLLGGIVDILFP